MANAEPLAVCVPMHARSKELTKRRRAMRSHAAHDRAILEKMRAELSIIDEEPSSAQRGSPVPHEPRPPSARHERCPSV